MAAFNEAVMDAWVRRLRRASDNDLLRMLQSPPPPLNHGVVAAMVIEQRRGSIVQRALEQGLFVFDPQGPVAEDLVLSAASHGPLSLLRSFVLDHGLDADEPDEEEGQRPLQSRSRRGGSRMRSS